MSHFTVIVVGSNVVEQMEPYAEQDFDEQYAKFEDTEDNSLEEYKNKEVDIVVLADGSLHNKYEEQFRHYDSKSFSSNYTYPEGAVIRKGKFTELYPTFEEYMAEWNGSSHRDAKMGRYGYWHNPNSRWDWWIPGGRWMGFFKAKEGSYGEVGEPGAFDNKAKDGWVDSIKLKDIDIEGMLEESIKEANETYDKLESILKGRPLPSWNAIRDKHGVENIEAARSEYNSLQVVKDFHEAKFHVFGDFVETFCNSREEYVEKCKNQTMVPYAVVKDGKWYQKGEMGWWGMSNDEMSQDEWNKKFWEMINSLDPETELNLLDCHI